MKHCPGFRSPPHTHTETELSYDVGTQKKVSHLYWWIYGKWAQNSFEISEGWSFDFFSRTGIIQEASVFSTVFDDKNPFRAYNLMRIHTWTSRKGFERQLLVFIAWITPAEPLMHFQKLKSDFPLRLLCGISITGLCSQLPAKQSPLLLTPWASACWWEPSNWAQHF